MTRSQQPSQCPLCGGEKKAGTTTFTADFEFGVVVVRHVPALVCALCGADWIQDDVAVRLEAIVTEAKTKRLQVEVTSLA
jgi:YgiT-type zinc finger domain-containing protein